MNKNKFHNMTQEQLKRLFKYIEANWDVAVEDSHKTDIKRILGVVLNEAKAEPELNEIERAYERGEKIRRNDWLQRAWIQKLTETESTSDTLTTFPNNWDFSVYPEEWELYHEPELSPEEPSSQAILDNSFDRERFEAMFRAVVASGRTERWEQDFKSTEEALKLLDAYYASKEGGNND